ncbi:MAG TPA: hypothetical protein ENG66_00040 [Thermococcus sp.]|nr:hypothetical protein [Thermococcus sp.]
MVRVIALKHRCPYSHQVVRAVTLFNCSNLFSDNEIEIIFTDDVDFRLLPLKLIFRDKPIFCPSGIIDDRFINNTFGAIHDYTYIKKYAKR